MVTAAASSTILALTTTETTLLWGLHHPYWTAAIAIAAIVGVQVLITLAGQLVQRGLRWLGKSPFFLGRWLLTKTPLASAQSQERQIADILAQLSQLQTEQQLLIAELKNHLAEKQSVS